MKFGVMITNGPGGHPPWKHAEVTADKLIVDPLPENDLDGAKTSAASELRYRARQFLETQHAKVRDHELDKLKTAGSTRLADPLEPHPDHLTETVAAIVALAKGTVLESHYSRPEVQAAMRDVLATEFRTQQNIHRSEHADKNPNDPHVKAFRAKHNVGA